MAFTKVTANKLQKQGEYKQNFRWAINFGPLLETLKAAGAAYSNGGEPSAESLEILCQSVEPPKKTIQTAEAMSRGIKIKIAGWADFGNTITITFMDTINNPVQNIIDAWQDLCFKTSMIANADGGGEDYGTGKGAGTDNKASGAYGLRYKTKIPLARVNMAGKIIYQVDVCGSFCEDFDPGGTLDEQSSDISKPSLTISFDTVHRAAVSA